MADADTLEPRNGIQVIARAAAVLRTLKARRGGLSLARSPSASACPARRSSASSARCRPSGW